ncbi:calcium-binding mitochondrial carrier protein SCaMC-3-like isoform X1 [Penaeus japonicus]|uniref:calcium-binding mitochondrial carrier protein SCaMC-3-like isoform X1 n=1 Tax=Penaeus japonicus TaxID=27405 RepID=UPI001C70DC0E|nr:calcium-binding mitochondrial carrier protein SCaMC-3-like isoform X1 [Penaeus japonicus]
MKEAKVNHPSHHAYEFPSDEEDRLGDLFKQLDVNGDGRIDVHDLSEGLKKLNIPQVPGYAELLIQRADVNESNDLTLAEFVNYVQEHEKRLLLVFHTLDANSDGRVDERELKSSFRRLGITITDGEAQRLLKRISMDKDGTLDISFDEWRDYLLFHPSANLHDIILYWRHATNLDVGEDLSVPDDFSLEEWLSGKWWRHLVAGGVAGMVSRTCTAPLDRLKVFLQVHGAKQFNSLTNCFRYMLQEGGVKSLWRGNGINVLKIAPESALKFAAYEQAKRMVLQFGGSKERELTIYERFVAGSFAGGFSQSVIYPLEVLKTRLALRKTGQYKSIADAAVKIYKQEGLRSFYRGYIPNILGIIPYAGIDLAIYETLKKSYMEQYSDGRNPSVLAIIACGAFSSSCGQVASYPLALVRTRLQAQVIAPGVVHNQPITMSGLFRHIIAKEGPTGLYRGITPNFMKVAPAVSISYVVYEKCRQMLGVSMT